MNLKFMKKKKYQICLKCVMDVTDPEIIFDEKGVCNHCNNFKKTISKRWFPNDEGKKKLSKIFSHIKKQGNKQEYDCIIGLSGGVDSSYLALVLKDYGLRPLAIHVDAGWNSELAVYNIEQIIKYCRFDLHTVVMDWSEVKDLQLAYLKSGVINQDVVQDHAFIVSLYEYAVKNKIKYIINGGNIATESIFPHSWKHPHMDSINLKSIHKKFGKHKLINYRTMSLFNYFFYYPLIKDLTNIQPLNFMEYDRAKSIKYLEDKVGYKNYGLKHGESQFTKFYQNYYLPKKFNIDKRRPHLSSQILSGELTRKEALNELKKPLYNKIELNEDKIYIAKKLGISLNELDQFITREGRHHAEYANWNFIYKFIMIIKKVINKI